MKIALATDNRKNIALRTGRAKEFAIYHISGNKIVNVEYKPNTHHHHHHNHKESEHHHHSHKEIVDILKGVDLLLVRAISKHFKRDIEHAGISYKLIKIADIPTALKPYL